MPPAVYEYEGSMLRVDDGVLELFSRVVLGSKRIPLAAEEARLREFLDEAARSAGRS